MNFSWGQVAITIHNRSENGEAFNRELYGDKVIVERRITKNGSSYKLKSHDGKTISNSKKDLTLMLDHYNIQARKQFTQPALLFFHFFSFSFFLFFLVF